MAMNDDNSLMDFIMRVGAMILLGVLLVSFAGFIFPVLGLLLLGACIYGYFYWRRIRRAVQQAQEQAQGPAQGPDEPQPDMRRDKLDTSGISDAKEVDFTKE